MEHAAVQVPNPVATPVRTQVPSDFSGALSSSFPFQITHEPKPGHRTETWKSRLSSSSTVLAEVANTFATRALDAYDFAQTQLARRGGALAKIAGIAGFVIACVALWSTLSAMDDSRRSIELAEWTARKDFLEFCQSSDYKTPGCENARGMILGPPPISIGRNSKWSTPAWLRPSKEPARAWRQIKPAATEGGPWGGSLDLHDEL